MSAFTSAFTCADNRDWWAGGPPPFDNLDSDGDGCISQPEAEAIGIDSSMFSFISGSMDSPCGDLISPAEYAAAFSGSGGGGGDALFACHNFCDSCMSVSWSLMSYKYICMTWLIYSACRSLSLALSPWIYMSRSGMLWWICMSHPRMLWWRCHDFCDTCKNDSYICVFLRHAQARI